MKFKDVAVYLLNIAEICGRIVSAFDIYQVITFSRFPVGWCDTGTLRSSFHNYHFWQHLNNAANSVNFFSDLDSPSLKYLRASICSFPSLNCTPLHCWPEVGTASDVTCAYLAPQVMDQTLLVLQAHWIWEWWTVQQCTLADFQVSPFSVHNLGAPSPRSSGASLDKCLEVDGSQFLA